jgi:hypothetical protein
MPERHSIHQHNKCYAPELLGKCSIALHCRCDRRVCCSQGSAAQIHKGVAFSTYEVRVDRMTVLRGNTTDQAMLLASAANGTGVISVVAFRSLALTFVIIICGIDIIPGLHPLTTHFHGGTAWMAVTLLFGPCRGKLRSPARYFHSEDSGLTGATGAARELAVIARVGALAIC